jgi:gliding motility-associated lipoprotein GldH
VILFSCSSNTYEDYYSFNHKGWNSDTIIKFKYNIKNIKDSYALSLKIRHTVDYEFQNLYLFLEGLEKDTIEIVLANKSGKWLGSGISDVREFEYVVSKKRSFSKQGEYKLRVEQAMRYGDLNKIENLEHILDVGLEVSKYNE